MTSKEAQYKHPKAKPRCEVCHGRFGLIRHRSASKQFCSKQCVCVCVCVTGSVSHGSRSSSHSALRSGRIFRGASAGPQAYLT